MAEWIKVYGLGDQGVNVSNDPLHTQVGDVVQAQNSSFYGAGVRGGLSKRLGNRILASGLNGAILAILSVTLTDPTPAAILVDGNSDILTDDVFLVLTETS